MGAWRAPPKRSSERSRADTRAAISITPLSSSETVQVADHQQRRVLQVLAILEQLLIGGHQATVLALVLPGEVAALPNVGEASPAPGLVGPLLEGVRLT